MRWLRGTFGTDYVCVHVFGILPFSSIRASVKDWLKADIISENSIKPTKVPAVIAIIAVPINNCMAHSIRVIFGNLEITTLVIHDITPNKQKSVIETQNGISFFTGLFS